MTTLALSFLLTFAAVARPQDSPDVPKVIQHSQPIYPSLAQLAHIQGNVRLKVTTDGESVTQVEAITGDPLLCKAAADNVRTWKLAPHSPATFFVTFRYKLVSDKIEVEFLEAPGVVQIEATPPPITSIQYAWASLGTWRVQLMSSHDKTPRTLVLRYSGPDDDWLGGELLNEKSENEKDDERIGFGHREGDFVAFTIKLRQSDGTRLATFFVGSLKGNRIIGTFVDDAGGSGKWTAIRLPQGSEP